MSPRAAWRLESLGYEQVYDYVAGKQDWLAFGLPYEGSAHLIADDLTADTPTCSFTARLGDVRTRLQRSRFGALVVVNEHNVVLGRVNQSALDAPDETLVEELMHEGPATVRPSEEFDGLVHRMAHAGVDFVVVTRSDGTLLGLFQREAAGRDAA